MEPGHNRPNRARNGLGHLLVGVVFEIAQFDRLTVGRWQGCHRGAHQHLNLVADELRLGRALVAGLAVGYRHVLAVRSLRRFRASGIPAHQIQAGVTDDAMEPGWERSTTLEGSETAPNLEEGLLDCIFGVISIVENPEGSGHGAGPHGYEQLIECCMIPSFRPINKIVDLRLRWRDDVFH